MCVHIKEPVSALNEIVCMYSMIANAQHVFITFVLPYIFWLGNYEKCNTNSIYNE